MDWATASEDNFHYFSIQRSGQDLEFQEIGRVSGAGYSTTVINYSFEDPNLKTEDLRLKYYGQEDHVRVYGQDFFVKLKHAGFLLQIKENDGCFSLEECRFYGVNPKEDLILVSKSEQS